MFTVRFGGKTGRLYSLVESDNLVAVRTISRGPLKVDRTFEVTPVSAKAVKFLDDFELLTRFREAGVEVLRTKTRRNSRELRNKARSILKKEPDIEFAGRVLVDPKSR